MTKLERARQFAQEKHARQTYNERPYVHHLDGVVMVLLRFGRCAENVTVPAMLHDVLEDTDTTREELVEVFDTQTADTVNYVTDQPGKNRAERHRLTYERLAKGDEGLYVEFIKRDARTVKLADRIANVETSLAAEGKSFFGMYRKEYPFFRAMLHVPGENEEMWAHLDALMASDWKVS